MRINFGLERASKSYPWLTELGKQFAEAHDMQWSTRTRVYLKSRVGSQALAEWLKAQGWKISYWELPPLPGNSGNVEYLAYGIDINDNCVEFIRHKLATQS